MGAPPPQIASGMCLSFRTNFAINGFSQPLALHVTVTRDASVMNLGPTPNPRNAIRILLVDDNVVYRAGVRALLGKQRDLVVVGEVGTGEEAVTCANATRPDVVLIDRKSTRLNSSHGYISYAVFCLKKKHESCWRHFTNSRRCCGASCNTST